MFKIILSAYFALSCLNQLVLGSEPTLDDGVYVLTEKNFDKFVNNKEFAVVFFYAPWCGHCVSMKPNYHEAARIFKSVKTKVPIVLTKVDATVEKSLGPRFQVPGYPTLKILRKGKPSPYDGPRGDGKAIVDYLLKEANQEPTPSKVVKLDRLNMTSFIKATNLTMIYFYSKSCKYCEELEPEYEKAANILSKDAKMIKLAKIDGAKENDLTVKYKLPGYPSLLVFKNDQHFFYNGPRNSKEIVRFMRRSLLTGSREMENFNKFYGQVKKASEIYVLGLFNNETDELFKTYQKFGEKYVQEVDAFHTFNVESVQRYLKSEELVAPSIIVYFHIDVVTNGPKFMVFNNENATLEDIENFVFKKAVPKIGFLSPQNRALIYDQIRPVCYLIFSNDVDLKSHLIYIRDQFHLVIKNFKHITFVIGNQTENSDLMKKLKIDDSESETKLACFNNKRKGFAFQEIPDGFNTNIVETFLTNFDQDKVPNHFRTEQAPKDDPMQVKTLVGSTLELFAKTPNKEVVIALVKRGSSAVFEAYLNVAALGFIMDKNIIFGKMNILTNDYPDYFKTNENATNNLFFLPSYDKKNPILYTGKDDAKEMELFIKKNLEKTNDYYMNKDPKKEKAEADKLKETKKEETKETKPEVKETKKEEIKETKPEVKETKKEEIKETKPEVKETKKEEIKDTKTEKNAGTKKVEKSEL